MNGRDSGERPRHLEREWQELMVRIEIEHAPADQLREMRRAFFAGARAYSALVARDVIGVSTPTVRGLALLRDIEGEMEAFAADVAAGHD